MISENTKSKLINAMSSSIRSNPKNWDSKGITIITNAIIKGKEIRGKQRRGATGILYNPESHKLEDAFVLEGKDGNIKLAVQIPKRTAFSPTNFSFQAFRINGDE